MTKKSIEELKLKQKQVTDLSLYRALCIVLKDVTDTVISILKDVKVTLGYEILKDISEMIRRIIISYREDDINKKYKEAKELYYLYEHVSCLYLMLFESTYISLKQLSRFCIYMGDFGDKANRWLSSLESRMNKPMAQN